MAAFSHIIFDLDGTLADTAKATDAACKTVCEKLGFPPLSGERIRAAMGFPGIEFYNVLLEKADRRDLSEFQKECDAAEDLEIRRNGRDMLFPGIWETLKRLKEKGTDLFIASTGSPAHVNLLVDITGIRSFFAGLYYGQPRKVEMTREIITRYGKTGNWLFVGDKSIDAEAAGKNGIPSAGAMYGYCTEPELFDIALKSPGDLLSLETCFP
jgi:phosphoglycolate phosphatase